MHIFIGQAIYYEFFVSLIAFDTQTIIFIIERGRVNLDRLLGSFEKRFFQCLYRFAFPVYLFLCFYSKQSNTAFLLKYFLVFRFFLELFLLKADASKNKICFISFIMSFDFSCMTIYIYFSHFYCLVGKAIIIKLRIIYFFWKNPFQKKRDYLSSIVKQMLK